MNLSQVKKLLGIFIRVFIIVFVFIMDVKVRAEEVKVTHNIPDTQINLEPRTLLSERGDRSFDFFQGQGFYIIRKGEITLHTPHGVVYSNGGEFIIEVNKSKTLLSVLRGEAEIKDRATNKVIHVPGGYSYWLGGLLAKGVHAAPVALEAYDMDSTMAILKNLSGWSEVEFDQHLSDLRPLWKEAVNKIAIQIQDNLNKDIDYINKTILAEEKEDLKRKVERLKVQRLFRERALGEFLPSQETRSSLPTPN